MFAWRDNEKPQENLTIVLIGDYSVGKTCIFERLAGQNFTHDTPTTIGVDFRTLRVKIGDSLIKVKMWDTAGMERFRSIVSCYFAGSQVVLMICDCTNTESIVNLKRSWLKFMYASPSYRRDTLLYVVVNKWDIKRRMDVTAGQTLESKKEFVRKLLGSIGHRKIFFVSAKTGENLEDMLGEVVKDARQVLKERGDRLPTRSSLRIVSSPEEDSYSNRCCCELM